MFTSPATDIIRICKIYSALNVCNRARAHAILPLFMNVPVRAVLTTHHNPPTRILVLLEAN